jgi:hypothetical protein
MEISRGNALCSYLYKKKKLEKCHVFLFVFSLLQNQRSGGQNRSCPEGRFGSSGRQEVEEKGG